MAEKVIIETIKDKGSSKEVNQDDCLVMTLSRDPGVYVCAVADGVGSYEHSGLASAFTLRMLKTWFEEAADSILCMRFEETEEKLRVAVKKIHMQLVKIAKEKGIEYGTTLTLLCIIDNSYIVLQTGDSRCYLYENHVIRQITRDQTLAERKRSAGESVTDRKEESVLTQCLGKGEMEPAIFDGILSDEYVFLVNSDGLSNTLSHKQIADTVKTSESQRQRLLNLVSFARANGEKDNISAILLQHFAG